MSKISRTVQITCVALLGFAPASYAQQPMHSGMSNMSGMSGSRMQTMMKQCAQMHQQMGAGKPMSASMHKMMVQCDQMDGMMKGDKMGGMQMNAPAPDTTQSR